MYTYICIYIYIYIDVPDGMDRDFSGFIRELILTRNPNPQALAKDMA